MIAEAETSEEPAWGFRHDALGTHALGKLEDGRRVRVVLTEQRVGPASEPTLRDLSEALIAVYGTDYGIHSPTRISRFTDMTRQAAAYRDRRVPAGRRRRTRASPGGWSGSLHGRVYGAERHITGRIPARSARHMVLAPSEYRSLTVAAP